MLLPLKIRFLNEERKEWGSASSFYIFLRVGRHIWPSEKSAFSSFRLLLRVTYSGKMSLASEDTGRIPLSVFRELFHVVSNYCFTHVFFRLKKLLRNKGTVFLFYLLTQHKVKRYLIKVHQMNECQRPNLWILGKCSFFIYFYFYLFVSLGPHPWHMEVPRLGVESELLLLAYARATAMPDPSRVCDLHHSSWPCRILNPLSRVRDRNLNLMVPIQICFSWATMGTPLGKCPIIAMLILMLMGCYNPSPRRGILRLNSPALSGAHWWSIILRNYTYVIWTSLQTTWKTLLRPPQGCVLHFENCF